MLKLRIIDKIRGRAIKIDRGGKIYIGRKYRLYSYDIGTKKLSLVARIPCPALRRFIQPSRLLCRLFRHEIRGFVAFPDGSKVVAVRQGLYYGGPGETILKPASISFSSAVMPPTSITKDSQGRILWGEYWSNKERRGVRIFCSEDQGKNYECVFEFKAGEFRHIHSIMEDPYDNCYWVFAGDHGTDPGIARLSKDFKDSQWLVKGEQKYRAVRGFIFKDKIVYGTDTEMEFNSIYSLDKSTGKIEKLCDTPGSALFSGLFGKWYVVATGVEYFRKYRTTDATLWVSQDCINWEQVLETPKDIWFIKYFQFGALAVPTGQWERNEIVFSGQALKKIDNKVCIAQIEKN